MGNFFARGLAAAYRRGRSRVRQFNADRERHEFIERLFHAMTGNGFPLTHIEAQFVCRMIAELNEAAPALHPGDANICDSLKRKYVERLLQLESGVFDESADVQKNNHAPGK